MKKTLLLHTVLGIIMASCNNDEAVICATVFEMVRVEIEGKTLDSFYTIDVKRCQKIYHTEYKYDNWYPIATDMLQPRLVSNQGEFLFIGFISGNEVIREKYIIGADRCHIYKISGPEKIDL